MFIKSLILFLVLPSTSLAHEESCMFMAKISGVKLSDRGPQGQDSVIKAEVSIVKAESVAGQLSYLDCKHWENQTLTDIEIQLSKSISVKDLAGKIVQVRYQSRKSEAGLQSSWKIVDTKTN